jgi:hypothetical protein
MDQKKTDAPSPTPTPAPAQNTAAAPEPAMPTPATELGGAKRLEPTRYGDWELNGKCVDF